MNRSVTFVSFSTRANSRVKDYFDLWVLFDRESLNMNTLAQALAATFSRRGTAVPTELPAGLTDEFANDPTRQALWTAFLRKNELEMIPLEDVIVRIRALIEPTLRLVAGSRW